MKFNDCCVSRNADAAVVVAVWVVAATIDCLLATTAADIKLLTVPRFVLTDDVFIAADPPEPLVVGIT